MAAQDENIRIGQVTTRIQVADASALLTPELLDQIVTAVLARMEQEQTFQRERREDTAIRRGARPELE